MSGCGGAWPFTEDLEPIVEACREVHHRQQLRARSRQFDRQRHSLQARADACDRPHLLVGRCEPVRGRSGTFDEQLHRRSGSEVGDVGGGVGGLEGGQGELDLPRHGECFPAGREDPQVGAVVEETLDCCGGGVDDVFAVVEHEQPAAMAHLASEPPLGCLPGEEFGLWQPEGVRHRRRDVRGIGGARERDEPGSVVGLRRDRPGGLESNRGLARASGAGHGHEPLRRQQRCDLRDLVVAPNDGDEPVGQGPALGDGASRRRLEPLVLPQDRSLEVRQRR